MSKSVIIYGGSFNPPTLAHRAILEHVYAFFGGDKIKRFIIAPVYSHAYGKSLADFGDRLAMCELAFSDFTATAGKSEESGRSAIVTSIDRALNSGGSMYKFLREYWKMYSTHPMNDFNFKILIGSDQALEIHDKWIDGPKLISEYNFIIVPRGDYQDTLTKCVWLNNRYKEHIILPPLPYYKRTISSTQAREQLSKHCDSRDYVVSKEVKDFCLKNKTYYHLNEQ